MPLARALNFHGIGVPGRELEPGEAAYWLSQNAFEDLIWDLTRWSFGQKVLLTFDDGNRSDIEIAAPVLRRHGLTGRVFVLTGRLGAPGSLAPLDVRALHEMGFGIGSHGIAHVDWSTSNSDTLLQELRDSRAALEEILGRPVTEAAIPFGRYNASVLRAAYEAGYTAVWTSDGGVMDPGAFLRPRLSIRTDMDVSEVHAALKGEEGVAMRMRRRLGMLKKRLL